MYLAVGAGVRCGAAHAEAHGQRPAAHPPLSQIHQAAAYDQQLVAVAEDLRGIGLDAARPL